MIDTLNLAARRKLGAGPEWQWCTSEAITGGFLLKGSRTIEKRNGTKGWARPMQKVILTADDLRAEEECYQRETGKCFNCEGTGQETYGFSRDEGKLIRPCRLCNATGEARKP